jgi:hypothetical protein
MVVIPADIRIQAADPEFLEQVSLSQVTDVVVNAASLRPARHRPNVAGEDEDAQQAAGKLQI